MPRSLPPGIVDLLSTVLVKSAASKRVGWKNVPGKPRNDSDMGQTVELRHARDRHDSIGGAEKKAAGPGSSGLYLGSPSNNQSWDGAPPAPDTQSWKGRPSPFIDSPASSLPTQSPANPDEPWSGVPFEGAPSSPVPSRASQFVQQSGDQVRNAMASRTGQIGLGLAAGAVGIGSGALIAHLLNRKNKEDDSEKEAGFRSALNSIRGTINRYPTTAIVGSAGAVGAVGAINHARVMGAPGLRLDPHSSLLYPQLLDSLENSEESRVPTPQVPPPVESGNGVYNRLSDINRHFGNTIQKEVVPAAVESNRRLGNAAESGFTEAQRLAAEANRRLGNAAESGFTEAQRLAVESNRRLGDVTDETIKRAPDFFARTGKQIGDVLSTKGGRIGAAGVGLGAGALGAYLLKRKKDKKGKSEKKAGLFGNVRRAVKGSNIKENFVPGRASRPALGYDPGKGLALTVPPKNYRNGMAGAGLLAAAGVGAASLLNNGEDVETPAPTAPPAPPAPTAPPVVEEPGMLDQFRKTVGDMTFTTRDKVGLGAAAIGTGALAGYMLSRRNKKKRKD